MRPNEVTRANAGGRCPLAVRMPWAARIAQFRRSAMRALRSTLYTALLVLSSGCAAIGTRVSNGAGRPYAGVQEDAYYLAHPSEADMPALQPLNVLDMPFSFVADTLCLPYDLVKHDGQPNQMQ